jgi:tRNA pseudouridine13 synthase
MERQVCSDPVMITADLAGIGGRIKTWPEDFVVDEIPAYQPEGQGNHLYLWVEKRDVGAEYFVRTIARKLGISTGEVGTAGLKDRHAVTRQMVSVPASAETRLNLIQGDGIRLLNVNRHNNKLRPGHLRGNRFDVRVRDTDPEAPTRIGALIDRIKRQGLPNYYGSQRFGHDGETAELGMELLHGKSETAAAAGGRKNRLNPFLRKLALSAAQSTLFNLYLCRRMGEGLLHRVLEGDVMAKLPFGGLFSAEDVAREQERFDRRETVHTGPIFGRKMFRASHLAAARESEALSESGLDQRSFWGFGKLLQGTRRQNIVYVDDLQAQVESEAIRLTFSLPAGSYATVLLKEVMKTAKLDSME